MLNFACKKHLEAYVFRVLFAFSGQAGYPTWDSSVFSGNAWHERRRPSPAGESEQVPGAVKRVVDVAEDVLFTDPVGQSILLHGENRLGMHAGEDEL